MGGAQSREGLQLSDSEDEDDYDYDYDYDDCRDSDSPDEDENEDKKQAPPPSQEPKSTSKGSRSDLDDIDTRLNALKLKYGDAAPSPSSYSSPSSQKDKNKNNNHPVKLYRHVGGNTPQAKWVLSDKLASYAFLRQDDNDRSPPWLLAVAGDSGSKVRARVSTDLQLNMFADQRRVDFVCDVVWALKFPTHEQYRRFVTEFNDCLFENVYGLNPTDENRVKVYGKDFLGWVKPDAADDSLWDHPDDEEDHRATPEREYRDLLQEFEEAANTGIQSLALGALDNSFIVGHDDIQVVKNFKHGIHGKGVRVKFDHGRGGSLASGSSPANNNSNIPKKGILMRGETNMMLTSPFKEGKPHSTGVHQLDIETGKIVTEWKFEKDGSEITMRDITNDTKGSQLDPSESTFLGLDDNRLCQWDMRERKGIVQTSASPVLHWSQGHQFSRGTNFQCFATTGDGSIVVGSLDGKIRLYSKTSMRQAKTAFPGLGLPITHVDVTYDGKWVLGTTDSYLILICTLFTDKDGKTKTGFGGRMGNKIPAPRMLKLTPLDSHLAGPNNKLHGGQFSWVTENGKQERHVVATVGKFCVIWNFQQVKNTAHECYRNQQGLKTCYCYKIVLKDESIIDSRFMHEKFAAGSDSPEAPLVVATPMKVSSFSLSNPRR